MNNLYLTLTNLLNDIKEPKYILELINTRFNLNLNLNLLKLVNIDLTEEIYLNQDLNEDIYIYKIIENIYFQLFYNKKLNKLELIKSDLIKSDLIKSDLINIKINNNILKLYNKLNIELITFDLSNLNSNFDENKFYIIDNKYIINGTFIFELIKLN